MEGIGGGRAEGGSGGREVGGGGCRGAATETNGSALTGTGLTSGLTGGCTDFSAISSVCLRFREDFSDFSLCSFLTFLATGVADAEAEVDAGVDAGGAGGAAANVSDLYYIISPIKRTTHID